MAMKKKTAKKKIASVCKNNALQEAASVLQIKDKLEEVQQQLSDETEKIVNETNEQNDFFKGDIAKWDDPDWEEVPYRQAGAERVFAPETEALALPRSHEKIKVEQSYIHRSYGPRRGFEDPRVIVNKPQPNYMEPTVRTDMERVEVLPPLEASEAKLPADVEMFENVRSALKIYRVPESTLIYAIVVDKSGADNQPVGIRCFGGVAFGGYARDVSGDAYLVECCQSVHLGTIPFSLRLGVPGVGNWSTEVPIPETILDEVFAPPQRKTLSDLRERFPVGRYDIHYLQMLWAN